jgi:hypothetical protein
MRSEAFAGVANDGPLLMMALGVATAAGLTTRAATRESLAVLDVAPLKVIALNMALLNMSEAFSVGDAVATLASRAAAFSATAVTTVAFAAATLAGMPASAVRAVAKT